jgi:hypothetical protein
MKGPLLLLAAASLLASGLRADHEDFVVISATASPAYTQRKFAGGSPRPESYVIFQGQYFGGGTRDPSLEHATFDSVIRTLGPDLARQNYLPLRNARFTAADLLIVVNWGTTVVDPMNEKTNMEVQSRLSGLIRSIGSFNKGGSSSDLNAQLAMSDASQQAQESGIAYNTRLLGYGAALQKESRMAWATPSGMDAMEEAHLSELIDERYFVILMAYDFQRMQRAKAARDPHQRPPQPKPVWIVRMNIRAAGNNFTQALPAMSQAASSYFGKQEDDLVSAQTAVGVHSRVEVGEPKVINILK